MAGALGTTFAPVRRLIAPALAAAVVLSATGCSEDTDDRPIPMPPIAEAEATLLEWIEARSGGDYAAACDLMTSNFSEQVVMAAIERGASVNAYCETAMAGVTFDDDLVALGNSMNQLGNEVVADLRSKEKAEVVVGMTVYYDDGVRTLEYLLVPVEGRWRLDEYLGARERTA